MIRIISGKFQGRRLKVPEGRNVRPTTNRVREALFGMLEHRIVWSEMAGLDLYAGSGALGLEALSRGTQSAVLVESSKRIAGILRHNVGVCGSQPETCRIIVDRAERWLPKYESPGIPSVVFLDPPYQDGAYVDILQMLATHPALLPGSWVVVESPNDLQCDPPSAFETVQSRIYGTIKIQLLHKPFPDGCKYSKIH
ncbi:MAG: 16S rRNA (guanine(966)-N(2))-methyltransferase RsmD [Deltaproteobacteria bacterium]|nr:16S rRNA (guanine(966)-N(2))-methyltransferase RsmD [Deltaproteobacteria bacterium]